MAVINTNVNAMYATSAGLRNDRIMSKAMQQLSTGNRINSAADDAAGLAITTTLTAQIRGLDQAVRNANDGISMLQVAEGATIEVTNMLQRMRELSVAAANGTNTTTEMGYLNDEYQELLTEIDRIADKTEWNGDGLIDGGIGATGTVNFQVGAKASDYITFSFDDIGTATGGATVAVTGTAISTQTGAAHALGKIDTALAAVNARRSSMGATINRLTYAADNLTNVSTNASAARSRMLDTDYATATTELARTQIIQQASTAMLAQANQQAQSVLSLLK